jgi:hypothetical protein
MSKVTESVMTIHRIYYEQGMPALLEYLERREEDS